MNYSKKLACGAVTVDQCTDFNKKKYVRHSHTFYEIVFAKSGEGKFILDSESHDLRANSMMLYPPYKFHHVEVSENEPYERTVIAFSENAIFPEVLEFLTKSEMGKVRYFGAGDVNHNIRMLMSQFENLETAAVAYREQMARLLLCQLLILLLCDTKRAPDSEDSALGARVMTYLDDKITSKITLDDIARDFFVSKSYLCRAFKEHSGVSILGYINSKRVMLAKELIDRGQTAYNASYNVGFADYSTFFRAYKRVTGKAPTTKRSTGKKKSGDRKK